MFELRKTLRTDSGVSEFRQF